VANSISNDALPHVNRKFHIITTVRQHHTPTTVAKNPEQLQIQITARTYRTRTFISFTVGRNAKLHTQFGRKFGSDLRN
jgi:hypothetical protein